MGTVFACPCPECGQRMDIRCDGDVECAACDARYRARMGYLLPLPRRGTTETPAATGGTTTVKRP